MNIEIFSFFAGTGLLDLGFETEGFKIAYANENHMPYLLSNQFAREKMGLPEPIFGYSNDDISNFLINGNILFDLMKTSRKNGDIIGFVAGPPCPDFSVAGKNRGRSGENGRLSEVYFHLISQHKPDFFLYENVKGLWRTQIHRTFYEELKIYASDSGYILTEQLINSLDYRVPQDRDRIILIGFSQSLLGKIGKDTSVSYPFLIRDFPWRLKTKYNKKDLDKLPWPKTHPFKENSILQFPGDIPIELTVEYWFQKNEVWDHPNNKHQFKPMAGLKRFLTVPEGDDSKKSYKRLHRWRYSPTAAYGNNEVHLHPYKPRRISAAEALAIQSLPKEFELPEGMSLSDMFKTIGNGVPYLVAKAISRSILEYLEN